MKFLSSNQKIIFSGTFAVILIATLFIMPYGDDWSYRTEPHFYDSLSSIPLFPENGGKWRPFDSLWGAFMGIMPWAYPFLNHLFVVGGHFLSAYLLFLTGKRFGFSQRASFISAMLFVISGNTFATFSSIDSLNQSLSLTFGMLAVWFFIKRDKPDYFLYLLFAILSVCWKESGFFFFLIAPLMRFVLRFRKISAIGEARLKEEYLPFLIGFVATLVYFFITFGSHFISNMLNAANKEPWSGSEFYNLKFGLAALLGRIIPVDLPSLLLSPRNYCVAFVSIVFGMPLIALSFIYALKKIFRGDSLMCAIFCIVLVFAVSHASVNAITEMNSYPCIFFASFFFLPVFESFPKRRVLPVFTILFVTACLTSLIHKYSLIVKSNRAAEVIVTNITGQTTNIPDQVFCLLIDNQSLGHDIYQPIAPIAAGSGYIMKRVWNKWGMKIDVVSCQIDGDEKELIKTNIKLKFDNRTAEEEIGRTIEEKLKTYDAVWVIFQNGEVRVAEKERG
ncbi:MAG: hypothetical protein PUB21_10760 [Bacteroidales bacterium]|nr:hypothetical protein [Bacteroidales bacterium]